MITKLCQHPDIRDFGLANHEAGEKLLPIIKDSCPVVGKGAGKKACYVCVERNESGDYEWEYLCLSPTGCQHRTGEDVAFRKSVPHTDTSTKHLIECSVHAETAFSVNNDAAMKYRRCTLENVTVSGAQYGCKERHYRKEAAEIDGIDTYVEVPVKKDKDDKVVDSSLVYIWH